MKRSHNRVRSTQPRDSSLSGFVYTGAAFATWGLAPVFWKALRQVPAAELLDYRVIFCAVFLALFLTQRRRWRAVTHLLRPGKTLATLVLTTALIGGNWFAFIWAVNSDRVLEASLGYFINPLVSVILGLLVLKEHLRPLTWASVGLATTGVVLLVLGVGKIPWVALFLAFSFGFYGLLRKTVDAPPEEGLMVETGLLTPILGAHLALQYFRGESALGRGEPLTDILLVAAGLITALPLVWFTHGARKLPLSTVGLLQYIAPTGHFLLAVFVFGEPFGENQLAAFILIWIALAIFTIDSRRHLRRADS